MRRTPRSRRHLRCAWPEADVSDSIWKKEISFKRKPKPDSDPDFDLEPPKQSFLKKEISFSRKAKEPEASDEPKAEKQSFLKKEISFSRKPKQPAPTADPEAEEAKRDSIWKKEIGFGKKQDRTVQELMQQAAAAVSPEPFDPQQPVAPPHPVELAESVVAAMPDPTAPEPVADVHPVEELPVDLPVVDAVPAPPMPPSPPLPGMPAEPVAPPAPPAPPVEPVAPVEPVQAVEPVEAWAAPEPAAPAPEPWLAEAELPPAPESPEPVVVHPPVPAAELPDIAAPKQSFLKKEISFSRKPKAPKAPKEPSTGQPFWKKELSFSRKPKPQAEAPTEQLPAVQAPPVWKREVKLSMPKLALPQLTRKGKPHSTKRLVGLKIGASQLAAARVSNNGVAELEQLARDPLASGIVVAGEPRDPEALGDALKLFFARHKLPRKGVRLGIASNRIGVRVIEIVGVEEDKQLANAVQFRAQEALPIPLDEAVLDYRVLGETVDAEGQVTKRVLLVVAYRELVDRYISACQKAGITLAGIDLEAFALLRALGAPADRSGSALVAVSIGHDRSTFAVSDGRNCEFTRVVDWGGSALNVALARAFDSTPSEVEPIKRGLSLDGSTTPEGLSAEQGAVALDAVRRQVQSFARELVSSLQFYQGQPGSLGIGEIVLTGGTAQLPGLAEELGRLIGVSVRVGDPLARLKVAKKVALNDQIGSLAVAIGLGIED
jgi:type IV pilus assembly protein PilM